MANAKPYKSMPFPLGKVTTTAGTAVQIVNNFSDLVNLTSETAQSVVIQALTTNTQKVYILIQNNNAAALPGLANCFYILAAGAGFLLSSPYGNQIQLNTIWIDVDVNGEGVISSIRLI